MPKEANFSIITGPMLTLTAREAKSEYVSLLVRYDSISNSKRRVPIPAVHCSVVSSGSTPDLIVSKSKKGSLCTGDSPKRMGFQWKY